MAIAPSCQQTEERSMLRLSGILWAADPMDRAEQGDLLTDHYDNYAQALLIDHEHKSLTFETMRHWWDDERYQCRISRQYAANAVQYLWCERRLVWDGDPLDDNIFRLSGVLWARDVANNVDQCDDLAYDLVVALTKWDSVTEDKIADFFNRCGVKVTPYTIELIFSFFSLVEFPITL